VRGIPVENQFLHRIAPLAGGIVPILIPARHAHHPLPQHVHQRMANALRIALVHQRRRHRFRQSQAIVRPTKQDRAAITTAHRLVELRYQRLLEPPLEQNGLPPAILDHQ